MQEKTVQKWQLGIGIIALLYGFLSGIFALSVSNATRTDNFIVAILGLGFIFNSLIKLRKK
jgi:hypothetical protein